MLMLIGLSFLTIEETMFSLRWGRFHALALVILVACIFGATARAPSRIVGGSDAMPGELPWQASIRAYDRHFCGGTIISNRHILTAAHCIVGFIRPPYSEVTIVTGSHTLEPGTGKAYRVQNITVHNKYLPRTKYTTTQTDIAVISLRKEIEVNEYQKPIALPSEEVPNGVEGVSSGFGLTGGEGGLSTALQKINVLIMGTTQCLESGLRIRGFQVCANNVSGFGTCKGDSGGPLVYNGTVVGVSSMSPVPCGNGSPDIYTRVYYYKDFIQNTMANI